MYVGRKRRGREGREDGGREGSRVKYVEPVYEKTFLHGH